MIRVAIGLQYDGTDFFGWQKQPDLRTVQSCVESALSRVADQPVSVACAGRTDTGVHATGQVIHFDTSATRNDHSWMLGGNSHLPDDVSIVWARTTTDDFHARFKAQARTYCYLILNRRVRDSIHRTRVHRVVRPLDDRSMAKAAELLIGRHDFTSFRSAACQAKTAERTVQSVCVMRDGDCIWIEITADAFLHHMVRNIAGLLIQIGAGDRRIDWARDVLAATDRTCAAETAPAKGLYLKQVTYPEEFGLPEPSVSRIHLPL